MTRRARQRRATAWLTARSFACLAVFFAGIIGGSAFAEAHAVLEKSVPADRGIEAEAPRQLVLQFDEPVGVTELRLLAATGRDVPLAVVAKNNVVQAGISESLAEGTYTIAYRVVSADGHPVAGAVQFQIGGGASHWDAQPTALAWWQWGEIGARFLLYLGGFTFCGLSFYAILRGTDQSPLAAIASLAVIAAACLLIGFQGAGVTGDTVAQLLSRDLWRQGGAGPNGRTATMFLAMVALGWLAWYLRVQRRLALGVLIVCAATAVLAISTAGHVAVLGWPQMAVLTIHVLVALVWGASLAPLWRRVMRPAVPVALPPMRSAPRISVTRYLLLLASLALVSGTVLACWQIIEPAMMVGSAYGVVLTVKIIAVLALIGMALANQRMARRYLARPDMPHHRGRRSVWIQLSLLILILGSTAGLSQLTPPRHLLAAAQAQSGSPQGKVPFEKIVHTGDAMATIRLQATGDGRYRLTATFSSMASGAALRPQVVTAALSNLDAHIGPLVRTMSDDGGSFVAPPLDLVPAGRWQISVKADLDDFDRRDFSLETVIEP